MLTRLNSPHQRGFTMIEMAIAMAIFGILLAAALPSIGTWMDNTRIRGTTEAIQSGIQIARSEAIRRNQPVSFFLVSSDSDHAMSANCTLSSTSSAWIVAISNPTGQCDQAPSDTTAPMIITARTSGDAGARVSLSAVDSTATAATSLTFNGFGRVMANADGSQSISQIDVTGLADGVTYRDLSVRITPQGMVRMCDPNPNLSSDDPRKC